MLEIACFLTGAIATAAMWLWKEVRKGAVEIEQETARIVAEYD